MPFGPLLLIFNVLKNFFSTEEKPVTDGEFYSFWMPLSDEERRYFREFALVMWRNESKRE